MTARQLHQLALSRNRTLRANAKHSFSLTGFKRWLDAQVEAGLLERRGQRYFLTDNGWWVATSLSTIGAP